MFYEVNVVYKSGATSYVFLSDFEIEKGDLIVVKSANGYDVVTALASTQPISYNTKATKFVINKVDVCKEAHLERDYKTFHKDMKRLSQLRDEFDRKERDRLLAEASSEARELLARLGQLPL